MNTKQKLKKTALVKAVRRDDPYLTLGAARVESDKFWRWGDDNLFPTALALMSRRSTTHRRIINDKADYISGKGFTFDPEVPLLGAFVAQVNGSGESLRQVCSKLSFDKWPQGGERLQLAFKPGWKSGDALYIPCDRESIVGHDCWFAQYPQLIWNPAKGISHYLEVVHELLQSRDYTCAPA